MPVDKKIVDDQIRALGEFDNFGTKKEVASLHEILTPDETIVGLCSGLMDNETWLVAVTNQRIILLNKGMLYGLKQIEYPIEQIKSVSHSTGMVFGEILIDTGGQVKKIDNVMKTAVPKIAGLISDLVHNRAGRNQSSITQQGTPDAIALLERLAAMKEKGLLSEEEFESEKKKILGSPSPQRTSSLIHPVETHARTEVPPQDIPQQAQAAVAETATVMQTAPPPKKSAGKGSKILMAVGAVCIISLIVSFFSGDKTEQDKNGTTKKIEYVKYDRVFNYDVESITLQKLEKLPFDRNVRLEKSLITDSTYVFSWHPKSGSGEKKFMLIPKNGVHSSLSRNEFDNVTRSNNVLICEVGIDKSQYRAGDYIYFIKDNKQFLEIDNTEKRDLGGRQKKEITTLTRNRFNKSDNFFILEIDPNFIRVGEDSMVIIDTQGRVVHSYGKLGVKENRYTLNIYGDLAVLSKDGNVSFLNLRTGKNVGQNFPNGPKYITNSAIYVKGDDAYFVLNHDGEILKKHKRTFLMGQDAPPVKKETYDSFTFLDDSGDAFLIYNNGDALGLKDLDGKILTKPIFTRELYAEIACRTIKQNTGDVPFIVDLEAYITPEGKLVDRIGEMKFQEILNDFSENVASAGFFFKNPEAILYGYFDANFNWIIPPVFDSVSPFENGVACVKYNGEWRLIRNPLRSSGSQQQPAPAASAEQPSPPGAEPLKQVTVTGEVQIDGTDFASVANDSGEYLGFNRHTQISEAIYETCDIGSICQVTAIVNEVGMIDKLLSVDLIKAPAPVPAPKMSRSEPKNTPPPPMVRVKNMDLNKAKNSCPDMKMGSPTTEEAVFLEMIEEGSYIAYLHFADGKTEAMAAGKVYDVVTKLREGDKVSATYQDEQFWTDEGEEGKCILATMLQSITLLPTIPQALTAKQSGEAGLREITLITGVKDITLSGGFWVLTGKTGEALKFDSKTEMGKKLFSICGAKQYTCTVKAKVNEDGVIQEILSLESDSPMQALLDGKTPAARQTPQSSSAPQFKPSFDCAKATTPVEFAVCSDPGLAQLDVAMANAYRHVKARTDSSSLVAEQRKWIDELNQQCGSSSAINQCTREKYMARIQQLGQYIAPAAPAPK